MENIFEEEKEYLEYAKIRLKSEIETCQKELIEIPKRYANVLQGDTFLAQGLMTIKATKLRKLQLSEKSPYFGRIDFLSYGNKEVAKIYIGKTNIGGDNNEQITTDWRTPICSLYYDSDLGSVSYEAPSGTINGDLQLKRQIIIKNGELIEVLDTNCVSNDELLQPYLSSNADNKMKTIIASIQKEQNRIIRKPILENLIIQGVAGSGKTSVALHRIAYLVYNLVDQVKSNQFLVVGPNKYFLNYISSILPELETEPIDQKTYMDLVNECLEEKLTLENQSSYTIQKNDRTDFEKIAEYKSSLNYKIALDRFLQFYLKNGIILNGIEVCGEEIYDVETIRSVLFSEDGLQINFERACNYFIKKFKENSENIYSKLNQKYRRIYISLPKDDPEREEALKKSVELERYIKEKGVKLVKDYFKKIELKSSDIYKIFITNIDRYTDLLNEKEIKELQKNTTLLLQKNKASFEDLPALLHINYMLYGINRKYKHIVIDEAQDYGLFHFDALKETFGGSTFSIYGDLAQSIYSYRSIQDWSTVASTIFNENCEILHLNKSYRTTIEITNIANKILKQINLNEAIPVIRHGEKISFLSNSNDYEYKVNKILQWIKKGYKTIAIICKTDKEAEIEYKNLNNNGFDLTHMTTKNTEYIGSVFLLTSALSKGLEFDAVIINNASSSIYSQNSISDMHLLYVACTRALHELDILYDNNLCQVFHNEIDDEKNINLGNKLIKKY